MSIHSKTLTITTRMRCAAKTRHVDSRICHQLGLSQFHLKRLQFLGLPKQAATFRVTKQTPNIVRVLRWSNEGVVQAKISPIGLGSFGDVTLF